MLVSVVSVAMCLCWWWYCGEDYGGAVWRWCGSGSVYGDDSGVVVVVMVV